MVAWVRVSSTAVGGVAAVVGLAPPARPGWVAASVTGLLLWSGLSAWLVLRRGTMTLLAALDVLIVVSLCVSRDRLVPAEALQSSAGTGWVDLIASVGVFTAQWGMRQPLGLVAGLLIAGATAIGASGSWESSVVLIVQSTLAAGITVVLRRGAATSDIVQAEEAAVRRTAAARAAVRADERDQQRHLHDTVLATLTMVNSGSIGRDSMALRLRARADLAVIDNLRKDPAAPAPARARRITRLDLMLRSVMATPRPGIPSIDVTFDLPVTELPTEVAVGITQSVFEALTNVARHARTEAARLTVRPTVGGVRVVVSDTGTGFDPPTVPVHRRGIRESIHGRMRSVGGNASTVSSPGMGTTIEMWWPDG